MNNQPKTNKETPKQSSSKAEQSAIIQHTQSTFELMVNEGLRCGGLHLVASKGFGKSRLLFSMADYVRNLEQSRVFIFDGSDSWLYGFSQIPVFNVNNEDITSTSQRHTLEFEHYSLNNWQLVKTALDITKIFYLDSEHANPAKEAFLSARS
jgi:hypothetical protein